MMMITTLVVSFLVCCRLEVRCSQAGVVSGLQAQAQLLCSFLCHTHRDGKDKLLEWPDRSCLLLYVSAHIH